MVEGSNPLEIKGGLKPSEEKKPDTPVQIWAAPLLSIARKRFPFFNFGVFDKLLRETPSHRCLPRPYGANDLRLFNVGREIY